MNNMPQSMPASKPLSDTKPVSQTTKLSMTPQKDFLDLTFEQLNQIEVRLSESEKQQTEVELQKTGEVKSKPVEFLGMSFDQLKTGWPIICVKNEKL